MVKSEEIMKEEQCLLLSTRMSLKTHFEVAESFMVWDFDENFGCNCMLPKEGKKVERA